MPDIPLLIKSRRLVIDLKKPGPGAVLVENGRVTGLADYDAPAPAGFETVDYGGLALMAGIVDSRFDAGETDAAAMLAAGVTTTAVAGDNGGFKISLPAGEDAVRAAMSAAAKAGRALFIRADWSLELAELAARLCAEVGARVHLVHLADGAALATVTAAKKRGLPLSAEARPQDLTFTAEELEAAGAAFPFFPPIRPRANRELLWLGLRDGAIETIASDESPRDPRFTLPAAWTGFGVRHGTLPSLSRLLCENPARLAGLERKGRIAAGFDADLIAWDPDASFVVKKTDSPYAGKIMRGVVRSVLVAGRRVYDRTPAVRP